MGPEIYVIDPGLCTECVGHFDEPQCVAVCPVECIDPDPEHPESQEQLLRRFRKSVVNASRCQLFLNAAQADAAGAGRFV